MLVTAVQYTGAGGEDTVGVTYSFQAAKVKQQYWEQSDKQAKAPKAAQVGTSRKPRSLIFHTDAPDLGASINRGRYNESPFIPTSVATI